MLNKKQRHLLKAKLKKRTVEEQFVNDRKMMQDYLEKSPDTFEKNVFKNLLTCVQQTNPFYRAEGEQQFHSVADANLGLPDNQKLTPAAALSHGGRFLIQISKLDSANSDPDAFIKWIFNQQLELAKERSTASHSIDVKDGKATEVLLDTKNPKDLKRILTETKADKSGKSKHKHFAFNVGLGGPADGSHGHVYMHYVPPTANEPGGLLFGIENSAPGKRDPLGYFHGPLAKSPKFSILQGLKFRFLDYLIKPARENGLRSEPTQVELKALMQISPKDFKSESLGEPFKEPIKPKEESRKSGSKSMAFIAKKLGISLQELQTLFSEPKRNDASENVVASVGKNQDKEMTSAIIVATEPKSMKIK